MYHDIYLDMGWGVHTTHPAAQQQRPTSWRTKRRAPIAFSLEHTSFVDHVQLLHVRLHRKQSKWCFPSNRCC